MSSILSTLVDSHHIFHPKQMDKVGDHHEPTILRRIAGFALLVLSFPFTLGIMPALYTYWAHRKVEHIANRDRTELQERTNKVFGDKVQGEESNSEREPFEKALEAIQKGNFDTLQKSLQTYPVDKDARADALLKAALDYDNAAATAALIEKYPGIEVDLLKVKSARMIKAILAKINKDDHAAFVNQKIDSEGNTALHKQQNLAVIKILVRELVKEGKTFEPNNKGESPLHLCRDPEIAKFLIQEFKPTLESDGQNILEIKDSRGRTPLFTAAPSVMWVLIAEGANVTHKDDEGVHVLFRFTEEPLNYEVKLFKQILSEIPEENKKDFLKEICNGYSILNALIQSDKANVEIVKALLEADAEYPGLQDGHSPLRFVKKPEVAACLIDHYGVKIMETKNKSGVSPLIQAKNNIEVFKVMIEKGVKVADAVDKDGDTILAYFSADPLKSNPELVDLILATFSDEQARKDFVNKPNTEGRPALDYKLPLHVVKAIVEAGAECPPAMAFARVKDPEVAKYLMEKFAVQINQKVENGKPSPLFYAKNAEVLKALVEGGLAVDVRDSDERTILHRMGEDAFRDHPELVSLIVDKVDEAKRKSFLDHVAKKPRQSPMATSPGPQMIKALKEAGASYPRFTDGLTLLHLGKDLETVKALVEAYGRGIVNKPNDKGLTPIFSNRHSAEVVSYLIDQGANLAVKVKGDEDRELNALYFVNNVEVAKVLIEKDIDVSEIDPEGDDAPEVVKGNQELVQLIKTKKSRARE